MRAFFVQSKERFWQEEMLQVNKTMLLGACNLSLSTEDKMGEFWLHHSSYCFLYGPSWLARYCSNSRLLCSACYRDRWPETCSPKVCAVLGCRLVLSWKETRGVGVNGMVLGPMVARNGLQNGCKKSTIRKMTLIVVVRWKTWLITIQIWRRWKLLDVMYGHPLFLHRWEVWLLTWDR